MIFVTVGAQMSFDRMIRRVDEWAGKNRSTEVFAQIGPSEFQPENCRWTRFLNPSEFRHVFSTAGGIVAHAGMGSIITALELGKPLLVMPRRGNRGETRNDHQFATAVRFRESGRIAVALEDNELAAKLDELAALPCVREKTPEDGARSCSVCAWQGSCAKSHRVGQQASSSLTLEIQRFIHEATTSRRVMRIPFSRRPGKCTGPR